jgi:hypothetical protein
MTSLAHAGVHLISLTATRVAFYATAATVIPVLFLAIAIQGNVLEDVLSAGSPPAPARDPRRQPRRQPGLVGRWLRVITAGAILWAGSTAEVIAMLQLFSDTDTTQAHVYVLVAVIILVVALAARPYGMFFAALNDLSWRSRSGGPEDSHPETGKTGTA